MADFMRSKNSKYLYTQYKEKTPEYIDLKTVGLCTAYRYYYDSSKRTATMTLGAKALIFRNGFAQVERGGKYEDLKYNAVMQGDVYISENDAADLLGCYAEYITNTQYAICLTETMETKADEILEKLME